MAQWSWIPGLPSLGPTYDLWAVDPHPQKKSLDEYMLLFLVVDDGDSAVVLRNRAGRQISLEDRVFLRQNHKKEYIEIGSRRLLVKRWRLRLIEEVDSVESKDTRHPPEDVRRKLPPREFNEGDIDELAGAIS